MEFSGQSELSSVPVDDAWLMLADPIAIQQFIPGCKLITPITDEEFNLDTLEQMADEQSSDETILPEADRETVQRRCLQENQSYGVFLQVGFTGLNFRIKAKLSVEDRKFPKMVARGGGGFGDYDFQMRTGVELTEVDSGSRVDWWLETDVSGQVFRWGSKLAKPIFKRAVNRFFNRIEDRFANYSD